MLAPVLEAIAMRCICACLFVLSLGLALGTGLAELLGKRAPPAYYPAFPTRNSPSHPHTPFDF